MELDFRMIEVENCWARACRTPRFCRSLTLLISTAVLATLSGCGYNTQHGYIKHDEELFPVTGRVLFEGQPAKNATVIFHRKRSANDNGMAKPSANAPLNPRGECNDQGEFEIFTYAADDGAPAGDYQVTVSWRDPEGTGREENFPELLPRHYLDPGSSGLMATVGESDSNDLPPFELKRAVYTRSD